MEISIKQKEFLELMEDKGLTELLIGGSAGGASVYGQEVKTPFGYKKIEDIKIGDQISNANGGVSRVIDIPYDGEIECYGVNFADGSYTEVSRNHLWKYKVARKKRNSGKRKHLEEYTIATTEQLLEKIDKHILVPLTKPVVFTRSFKVEKLSPYLVGVLIGDGSLATSGGNITLANPDMEIINKCRQLVSGKIKGRNGLEWRLAWCKKERQILDKLGLLGKHSWEKFIPDCYKLGSIDERKEILQGLIDTDGSVDSRGHLKFDTTSEQLAKDVQFVARSLGANATLTVDENSGYRDANGEFIKCRPAYSVYIQHEHKEWFVTLPRKLERIKPYNGGFPPHKRVVGIKPIGIKHARCLTTSAPDGLYLTDDFIVTHNSKSMCMGMAIVILARKYPGIRFFVGRKTLKSLKQSTINTLLTKVHPLMGVKDDEFAIHYQDMTMDYKNSSKIIFGELETQPSDPDFSRVGSLEIDVAFIDEAGEITLEAKNAIKSRVGRGIMTSKYDIPGKLILSANPSSNFLRQEYYDNYIRLGGGSFQKWQIGEITLSEGTPNEHKIPAYRGFLRMGAYDNPFLPQSYIDNLKTLPDRQRKRLLDGNWDYLDEDDMLFKSGLLEKAMAYEIPQDNQVVKPLVAIGCDIADKGKDRSVFTLVKNGVAITQKVSSVQTNWEQTSEKPLGALLADELIEFAQRNGITSKEARNIAIETNGVGASIRDIMKMRGWYITEYVATHKSRSENYYQLMLDMDSGALKVAHDLIGLDDLKRELSAHTYEMVNQEPSVCKKDKIKQAIGRSPDLADSLCIANFARNQATNPALNPKLNRNRIIF